MNPFEIPEVERYRVSVVGLLRVTVTQFSGLYIKGFLHFIRWSLIFLIRSEISNRKMHNEEAILDLKKLFKKNLFFTTSPTFPQFSNIEILAQKIGDTYYRGSLGKVSQKA